MTEARRWWRRRGGNGDPFGSEPVGTLRVIKAEMRLIVEDETGRRFIVTGENLTGDVSDIDPSQLDIRDVSD